MEFPEKLFLRRETVGIYMYFSHGIHWIPLIRTHFFENKVCRNAISRIFGHPTRFGKLKCSEKLGLRAFTIGIYMCIHLEFH